VMREAEALVKGGTKEILVISQDTSAYGVDLKYRTDFVNGRPVRTRMTELCQELSTLGVWIRLHYVYPYPHVDEVLPLMAENKILPYLDVPFQHAHPDVLKRMKRPASGEKNLERIAAWRAICPDLTIRSTFIVGFPGETEEEFEYLLEFLKEAQLDRVGCFTYSAVEGAQANALANPVSEEIKLARQEAFMNLQSTISTQRLKRWVGRRIQVLIDGVDPEEGTLIGRTVADAPDIDGIVRIYPDPNSRHAVPAVIGEFAMVDVVDSDEHDLQGIFIP
jgi:ribosomal protein S12 methylthiotransferase